MNLEIILSLTMSTVERIEAEISKLSLEEFSQLTSWLLELDEQRWNEQIAKDVAAGKLDFLAKEALAIVRTKEGELETEKLPRI